MTSTTKNYNVNAESIEHSKTIHDIKQAIHAVKKQLRRLPIGSLFSMDKMHAERKTLLYRLKAYKEMLVREREANRASICRANDGHYPSFFKNKKPVQTEKPNPQTNAETVDFVLNRNDVMILIGGLSTWLRRSKDTEFKDKVVLSILSSKLKKQSLTSHNETRLA